MMTDAERAARDAMIVAAYDSGMGYRQIRESTGYSMGVISRALVKSGHEPKPRAKRNAPRQPKQAKKDIALAKRTTANARKLHGLRSGECMLFNKAVCSGDVKPEPETGHPLCERCRAVLHGLAHPGRAADPRRQKAAA